MLTYPELTAAEVQEYTDSYNSYYSLIFSIIQSKTENFDIAEDICQEVFFRFYCKYKEIENPRKWLLGTMRIVIIDYYKLKKKQKTQDIQDFLDNVEVSYVNGFRDTRIIIEEALNNTENFENEKERALFELIAVNNFSYRSASKHLGMTYWQVRYGFEKVVKRILAYLENKGIANLEELL